MDDSLNVSGGPIQLHKNGRIRSSLRFLFKGMCGVHPCRLQGLPNARLLLPKVTLSLPIVTSALCPVGAHCSGQRTTILMGYRFKQETNYRRLVVCLLSLLSAWKTTMRECIVFWYLAGGRHCLLISLTRRTVNHQLQSCNQMGQFPCQKVQSHYKFEP